MNSLFPIEDIYPEGFNYTQSFISVKEEDQLIKFISTMELHTFIFQRFEAKRRVASFGFDYSFDNRQLVKGKEIPPAFNFLVEKVASYLNIKKEAFGELLVIEYPPGAVINWHRDAPPFDLIAGISLASDCIFKLRPQDKERQGKKNTISIPVTRRSLYIMKGASRSEWQHSIAPVKEKRYSITLRTLK